MSSQHPHEFAGRGGGRRGNWPPAPSIGTGLLSNRPPTRNAPHPPPMRPLPRTPSINEPLLPSSAPPPLPGQRRLLPPHRGRPPMNIAHEPSTAASQRAAPQPPPETPAPPDLAPPAMPGARAEPKSPPALRPSLVSPKLAPAPAAKLGVGERSVASQPGNAGGSERGTSLSAAKKDKAISGEDPPAAPAAAPSSPQSPPGVVNVEDSTTAPPEIVFGDVVLDRLRGNAFVPAQLPPPLESGLRERRQESDMRERKRRARGGWKSCISMKTVNEEKRVLECILHASFPHGLLSSRKRPRSPVTIPPDKLQVPAPGGGDWLRPKRFMSTLPVPSEGAFVMASPFQSVWSHKNTFWSCFDPSPSEEKDSGKEEVPEKDGAAECRSWPTGCRFLVLWGLESCASTHRSTSQNIENLISHLQSSPNYTELFGESEGTVLNHVQGNVDHREVPMALKLVQSMLLPVRQNAPLIPQAKMSTFVPSRAIFRTLFCTDTSRQRDRWIWSGEAEGPQEDNKVAKRHQPILTGVVEFQQEEDANAFYHASTYTTASNSWGGRLWSIPDHNGVKFWLHTIFSSHGAWSHATMSAGQVGHILESPVPPLGADWHIWTPCLRNDDLAKLSGDLRERLNPVSAGDCQGFVLDAKSLKCFAGDAPQAGRRSAAGETRTVCKFGVCCPSELSSWCEVSLSLTPRENAASPFARIPRYLHRRWLDEGEVNEKGSGSQKAYVTRVLLFALPVGDATVILTPAIVAEKKAFEAGTSPAVLRLAPCKPKAQPTEVRKDAEPAKEDPPVPRVTKRKPPPSEASPTPPVKRRQGDGNLLDRMLGQPKVPPAGGGRGAENRRGGARPKHRC